MEQLTKHQIILLAFLVSFVSSIATGIVVVSLMEQAPQNVVQTVNRIVERTVEVVNPNASSTRETIIVREDQATVDAIAKATKSLVRIYAASGGSERFVGSGVIVSQSGRVLAATSQLSGTEVRARLDGGNMVALDFVERDPATGAMIFQAEQSSDPKLARAYTAATLGDSKTLKLGQAVAAISGEEELEVATGIISSQGPEGLRTTAGAGALGAPFDSRAFLVNLSGEVVGMKTGAPSAFYVPSDSLKPHATP